jgi:hypothetical protein
MVFIAFQQDGKMYLFLLFFGARVSWATFLEIIPGLAYLIPDYARVNSRLALLRDFTGKKLISLTIFLGGNSGHRRKPAKFPARRE